MKKKPRIQEQVRMQQLLKYVRIVECVFPKRPNPWRNLEQLDKKELG